MKKTKKIPETEYVYAAARIHCVDGALFGREKYAQLAAAPGGETLSRMLADAGYKTESGDIFSALENRLCEAFSFVSEIAPAPEIFGVMRYPYDCNNLKAAIKCEFVRGFDFSSLYSKCGTVSEKETENAVKNRDFSVFPENMKKAAPEAISEYSETRDPQLIDIILDRACCADMLSLAEKSGEEAISDYVKNRIDMTNILTALRVIRMGKDAEFLRSACAEGGNIPVSELAGALPDGEDALPKLLKSSAFSGMFSDGFGAFAETERELDGKMSGISRKYKNSVFGPSSLLWYLCAVENEVKNIRIIIAGHAGAQPAETIIERIRESYV